MTDLNPAPIPAEVPQPSSNSERLLTIKEAAEATGLSQKAIQNRVDRDTLWSKKNAEGLRVVSRAELIAKGLLNREGEPGPASPQVIETASRELIVWKGLYDEEKAERVAERAELLALVAAERARADERAAQISKLQMDLLAEQAALASAGLLSAVKLRRRAKARMAALTAPDAARASAAGD